MAVTLPTVDDFTETTVLTMIRKVVDYLCGDLANGINNNDIVSGKFSVRGNRLSGTLTKGDGTTINIPAVTLPDGGGSDNPYPTSVDLSVSDNNLSINIPMSGASALKDTVALVNSVKVSTIDAGKINVSVNGKSSGNVQVSGTVYGSKFDFGIENNALYVTLVYWDEFFNAWTTAGPSIKLQDLANALKPYLS